MENIIEKEYAMRQFFNEGRKLFHYHQNNSGGYFDIDDDLTKNVIIEASNKDEANDIAKRIGIYFNGVINGFDCECCGDRWSFPDEINSYEAFNKFMKAFGPGERYYGYLLEDGAPAIHFYMKNDERITLYK